MATDFTEHVVDQLRRSVGDERLIGKPCSTGNVDRQLDDAAHAIEIAERRSDLPDHIDRALSCTGDPCLEVDLGPKYPGGHQTSLGIGSDLPRGEQQIANKKGGV